MLKPHMIDGRPHWETNFPKEVWPYFQEFRNFLIITWEHLGLPSPTLAQLEIAHRLQYGTDSLEWLTLTSEERNTLLTAPRHDIIRAFRAVGKSYITAAYAVWCLMRNPRDEKILVVSASGGKAKEFVDQVKGLIQSMELCKWLLDGTKENKATLRDHADQFDVQYSSISQSFSCKAVGVTGQITGSRATKLIADDIETPNNTITEDSRQRLILLVKNDFFQVTNTEHGRGDIIFLGTPQSEESMYNVLVREMKFRCFTIPLRYPRSEKLQSYVLTTEDGRSVDILAFYLKQLNADEKLPHGRVTDTRYDEHDAIQLEAQTGRSSFALQYMLDTSLSDAERYPLKQKDLIVMPLNSERAPSYVMYGEDNQDRNKIRVPNLGFSGDFLLAPVNYSDEWLKYSRIVMFVDPAGKGKDEMAWAVLAELNGTMFCLEVQGYAGDPEGTLPKIAKSIIKHKVQIMEYEPNAGLGIWGVAFEPILHKEIDKARQIAKLRGDRTFDEWTGCTCQESEWSKGQKELRIIDTIEPVLNVHRLVIDKGLVEDDTQAGRQGFQRKYSLLYQLTHITKDRGSLPHDDRIDALAGAVNMLRTAASIDVSKALKAHEEELWETETEDFHEMFEEPMGRGYQRGVWRDGKRDEVYRYGDF